MANKTSQHLGVLRSMVDLKLRSIESYHEQMAHTLRQEVREFERKIEK